MPASRQRLNNNDSIHSREILPTPAHLFQWASESGAHPSFQTVHQPAISRSRRQCAHRPFRLVDGAKNEDRIAENIAYTLECSRFGHQKPTRRLPPISDHDQPRRSAARSCSVSLGDEFSSNDESSRIALAVFTPKTAISSRPVNFAEICRAPASKTQFNGVCKHTNTIDISCSWVCFGSGTAMSRSTLRFVSPYVRLRRRGHSHRVQAAPDAH